MKPKINSIALFGTSADPPTLGHQALLTELTTIFPKVITWASDNPDKKHQIPLVKRTQLLKILVKKISQPNLELVQELSSPRTINTLFLTKTMSSILEVEKESRKNPKPNT